MLLATTLVGIAWLGFFLWYFLTYNHLVATHKTVAQSWAHVDVELQRRFDLIGNLVEVVKGYARHEADVLEATTRARTTATDRGYATAQDANRSSSDDRALLINVMALVEQYPQLKADQQFRSLQQALIDTENRIALRRSAYNECVSRYEIYRTTIPSMIVAWAGHFAAQTFFDAQDDTAHAIEVKLS